MLTSVLTDLVLIFPLSLARQALLAAVATTISLELSETEDTEDQSCDLSYLGTRLGLMRQQLSWPEMTLCLMLGVLVTLVARHTVRLSPVLLSSITPI